MPAAICCAAAHVAAAYSAAQCGTRHRSWYWYAGLSYCALQGLHRPSEVPGSHSLVQSYSQRVGRRSTQRSNSDCYWLRQTGVRVATPKRSSMPLAWRCETCSPIPKKKRVHRRPIVSAFDWRNMDRQNTCRSIFLRNLGSARSTSMKGLQCAFLIGTHLGSPEPQGRPGSLELASKLKNPPPCTPGRA
jgi:hypothetical protein